MPLKERISAFDGLDITPEQREILEAIREFVDREVIPVAKELEARAAAGEARLCASSWRRRRG